MCSGSGNSDLTGSVVRGARVLMLLKARWNIHEQTFRDRGIICP
jgi:hypothetical protein